jgi:hypothetical protein
MTNKVVLKKEKRQYGGISLDVNIGSINSRLYFDDENEFQGFVYLLHLMAKTNAESVSLECQEAEDELKEESEAAAAEVQE